MDKLFFTFIIPHREEENIQANIDYLLRLCKARHLACEIFDITGSHPTVQRNRGIEQAQGKYVYFLDNDAHLPEASLDLAMETLKKNPDVDILGGPSIAPRKSTRFQKTVSALFTSPSAVGRKISSRYQSIGELRLCDDQELILCNLIVKKQIFEEIGLFDERLYPNEENHFIQVSRERSKVIMHHPDLIVKRSHRKTYSHFVKQLFRYGEGRAKQTKILPSSFKWMLIFPLTFPFYLSGMGLLHWTNLRTLSLTTPLLWSLIHFPLLVYLLLMARSWWRAASKGVFFYYPFLFLTNHIVYPAGFWWGMLYSEKRPSSPVSFSVRRIYENEKLPSSGQGSTKKRKQ